MNANTFKTILSSTISISDLTRAGAKKIFDNLNKDGSKIVLKNNKPVAALVSTDRYKELLDKEEDLQLIKMAMARMNQVDDIITSTEFFKNNDIDADSMNDLPVIEMEKE